MKETLVDACGLLAAAAVPTLRTPDRAARTSNSEVNAFSFNINQRRSESGALINLRKSAPKSV
jgi:hypothetical protein